MSEPEPELIPTPDGSWRLLLPSEALLLIFAVGFASAWAFERYNRVDESTVVNAWADEMQEWGKSDVAIMQRLERNGK